MDMLDKSSKADVILSLVSCIFFFLGIPTGLIIYPLVEDKLPELIAQVFAGLMDGSDTQMILNIMFQNARATLIHLLLGVTIVATLGLLFFNGLFIGLVALYTHNGGVPWSTIIMGLSFHGVFELPALFLASGMGINAGVKIFSSPGKRRTEGVKALKRALRRYFFYVLPLVVIAAIIEVLVSAKYVNG